LIEVLEIRERGMSVSWTSPSCGQLFAVVPRCRRRKEGAERKRRRSQQGWLAVGLCAVMWHGIITHSGWYSQKKKSMIMLLMTRWVGLSKEVSKSNFRQYEQMKSGGGKSQRREKKKEDQRRERVRRKTMQVREKVGKSQNIVFFK